jgi:hypothetical protein
VSTRPRGLELVFQLLVFTAQPLALGLRSAQILAQSINLPALLVDDLLRITRDRSIVALRHATLMPDSLAGYKWKSLRASAPPWVVGMCVARASVC